MKIAKKIKPGWMLILLLFMNVSMFGVCNVYFSRVKYFENHEGVEITENEYIDSGWRLLNWSLSLFKYFKGNEPQSIN
jgi:hypothetical protein